MASSPQRDTAVGALPHPHRPLLSLLFVVHPSCSSLLHTILPGGWVLVTMESQVSQKGEKRSLDREGAGAPSAGQWSTRLRQKLPPAPADSPYCGCRIVGSPRKEGTIPVCVGKDIIAACMHVTRQNHFPNSTRRVSTNTGSRCGRKGRGWSHTLGA